MKVKVKFLAEKEIVEDGKVIRTEIVKDALQILDLEGHKVVLTEFGKSISNSLIMEQIPKNISDIIEYRRFIERLHDNNGEEMEIDEIYIPIIKDYVKNTQSMLIVSAVYEVLDNAVMEAEGKEYEPNKK